MLRFGALAFFLAALISRSAMAADEEASPELGLIGTLGAGKLSGNDGAFAGTLSLFGRRGPLGLGFQYEQGGAYHGYRYQSFAGAVGLDHRDGHVRLAAHLLIGIDAYDNSRFSGHVTDGPVRSSSAFFGSRLTLSFLIGPPSAHVVVGPWVGLARDFRQETWQVSTNDDPATLSRGSHRAIFGLEIGLGVGRLARRSSRTPR